MLFAIRDDDVSYWTKPEELENLYKPIWSKGIPVSLSLIPFSIKSENLGDFDKFYQDEEFRHIGDNKELVYFIREKQREKLVCLMMHGYTHQYKVALDKNSEQKTATKDVLDEMRKVKKGRELYWIGEYRWKRYEQLLIETKIGKEYLEDIFKTKIKVFVPPSNDISREGVRAVSENRLNLVSSISIREINRPLTIYTFINWAKNVLWRLVYGRKFPFVMNYGTHKEVFAHGFTPDIRLENLIREFNFCYRKKAPFILSLHYWEINSRKEMKRDFFRFIEYTEGKAEYISVNKIIEIY